MKTIVPWIILFATLCIPASTVQSAAPKLAPERVTLRVIKVFAAQDGEYRFRAYLVDYMGQELIVEDALTRTNYRSDDDIPVLVMKHPHPDPKIEHGLLKLVVIPAPMRSGAR